MSTTHVSDEPFFQFDPYEALDSPPMNSPSDNLDAAGVVIDPSAEIETPLTLDKGKQVSRPLPIMISAPQSSEFDGFGVSPAWSASSSYPDTPDTTAALSSAAGSSSFPSFTLGSFSSVWQSSSSGFDPDTFVVEGLSSSSRQNQSASPALDGKGKGKERDIGPPAEPTPLTVGIQGFSSQDISVMSATEPTPDVSQPTPSFHVASRLSPSRRHSICHSIPRSRRPSSLTRLKARFNPPGRSHTRKVLSKKLPTSPVQLAIPQLTQTTNIHLPSHAQLPTEVKLPFDDGVLETTELCMSMHSLFKTKGRSNSSPLPMSALDYVPRVAEDVFVPITFSQNFFDELLPKELKLQIIASLVALHEDDHVKLIAQTEWSVTRAISSKNRWLGKDKAIRELVKLSRVSRSWHELVFDGQLWSTLDLRSFPAISKTILAKVAKSGGRFIGSIDLSGHVHINPATLMAMSDNMCLPSLGSVIPSPPCTQLTSLNFRGCTALSTRSLHYLLVRSPSLQQVCFRGLQSVTNTTCDIIAMYCSRITKLDLNRCHSMDAEGLKRMMAALKARGQLLQLTELRISGLRNIDDEMMALLGQVAPFLEVLDLSYARQLHNSALDAFVSVCDSNLAYESVLLTAREIGRGQASDCNRYRRRVTRLRHVSLSSCILLTDIACSHLAHAVPRLELLELGGIGEELGDDGLIRLLKTTPMIRRLDLEDATEITDAVLNAVTPGQGDQTIELEPGHALEHLIISYATDITDNGLLTLIRNCPRLQVLEADNTRMGPSVLQQFCELQRPHSKIVAVDCRSITESLVKDLAPLVRPRRGWRGWDARKLRFLDGRDFGAGQNNNGERDKEKETVMKAAQEQDELDEKRVVLKAFYSWQIVDAVWAARDKRRKAIARRKANESSGSTETDSEDVNVAGGGSGRTGGTRWWSPGGRRSRSASGSNSPLLMQDPSGGDMCIVM